LASEAIQQPFGTFYQLLILTGQRREEVAGLNWAELDRTAAIWTIPADRAKNGVAHIVPLSAPVIAEMDRLAGDPKGQVPWPTSGYAVTTTGRSPISGFSKAKAALDAAVTEVCVGASLSAWRVHDLRRTMATGFQRLGVRFEVTEATLNHVSGAKSGVAGIYQRHDWREEKRAALEAWGRHISKFTIPASQDNVVSNATAQMG
jgi:integrase